MVSQHRQRTQDEPRVIDIVLAWLTVAVSSALAGYVLSEPGFDTRKGVALVLFIALSGSLTRRAIALMAERAMVRARARREEERSRRDAARQERVRAHNTGTWSGSQGEELSVRWDPLGARFWVRGWLSETWQVPDEVPWRDAISLAQTLDELELSAEMVPADDEGTRNIRARLLLPELAPVAQRSVVVPVPHRYADPETTFSGFTPAMAVRETDYPQEAQDPDGNWYDDSSPSWSSDRTEVIPRQS